MNNEPIKETLHVELPDVEPKAPVAGAWTRLRQPDAWNVAEVRAIAYLHERNRIGVISTLTADNGTPMYLLAISRDGKRRVGASECQMVLVQFDLAAAEEVELPGQGFVRHFVRPIPVVHLLSPDPAGGA